MGNTFIAAAGTVAISTRTIPEEQGGAVRVNTPFGRFAAGRFANRPTTFSMNSSGRTAVRKFGTPVF